MAVSFRVHILLLREEQPGKQRLPLQEEIVFIRVLVVVGILDAEDVIAEAWNHEQLLVE